MYGRLIIIMQTKKEPGGEPGMKDSENLAINRDGEDRMKNFGGPCFFQFISSQTATEAVKV